MWCSGIRRKKCTFTVRKLCISSKSVIRKQKFTTSLTGKIAIQNSFGNSEKAENVLFQHRKKGDIRYRKIAGSIPVKEESKIISFEVETRGFYSGKAAETWWNRKNNS